MTIDEFKKVKISAMKEKDKDAVDAYNNIISKLMLISIERKAENKELSEADVATVLKKIEKELIEEIESFSKAGRNDTVISLNNQLATVKKYIPEMLSADKIKEIITSLIDKQVPTVMRYFKENYAGKVDMKLVSEVLKSL